MVTGKRVACIKLNTACGTLFATVKNKKNANHERYRHAQALSDLRVRSGGGGGGGDRLLPRGEAGGPRLHVVRLPGAAAQVEGPLPGGADAGHPLLLRGQGEGSRVCERERERERATVIGWNARCAWNFIPPLVYNIPPSFFLRDDENA